MNESSRRRRYGGKPYPNHTIKINCFIAVIVDFDVSPQHINKSLPLQALRKLSEFVPVSLSDLRTVRILLFFDLAGLFVRLAECPLSAHTIETIDPRRVFATSVPGYNGIRSGPYYSEWSPTSYDASVEVLYT